MTYSDREFGASQSDYPKEQQMSDIVERLRKLASIYADPDIDGALWKERDLLTEAAAEIERLRAGRADPEAVEAARRILKPFKRERPTVAELEAILRAPDGAPVTINPDGSIGVGDTDAVKVATALLASASSRAAVVEECAKEADAVFAEAEKVQSLSMFTAKNIAARIRALKGGAA
jgi:hypothetical protein